MTIKLSILICSTHTRYLTFGPKIQKQVWTQYAGLAETDQARIEIMMLTDNKKISLGDKRNVMVDAAQGEYVVFVDDDDRIEPDYMKSLLDAIDASPGVDVVVFHAAVSLNGEAPKVCEYSRVWGTDSNLPDRYLRIPNHICCVRRDLVRSISFPSIVYGEDSGYSKLLLPLLNTEHNIGRVLYHYDYMEATSEPQTDIQAVIRDRGSVPPIVDVVMLSRAETESLKTMTQTAVNTCVAGANGLPVNLIVVEQIAGVQYDHATTIHHEGTFNYNQFMNMGIRQGNAPWIVAANNDLLFANGWLHHLLAAGHPFVSPKCPLEDRQADLEHNEIGDNIGRHMAGWCFMVSRQLWTHINGFDEDFGFWCADDSVVEQLRAVDVLPMVVPASQVTHLGSMTGGTEHGDGAMTWAMIRRFSEKYRAHDLEADPLYQEWLSDNS